MASELESLHIESENSLASLETLASLASSDRLLDELKLRELTISQLRSRVLQLERARLDKIPLDPAREICRLQSNVVSAGSGVNGRGMDALAESCVVFYLVQGIFRGIVNRLGIS